MQTAYYVNEDDIINIIMDDADDDIIDDVHNDDENDVNDDDVDLKESNACSIYLQIFKRELEEMHDFNGFNDWLHSFPLYRGKKTSEDDDDDHRIVGKFKVTGRRIVYEQCLYYVSVSTKIHNRCCTLLCFTSQSISG
jgi:hypothetical protein